MFKVLCHVNLACFFAEHVTAENKKPHVAVPTLNPSGWLPPGLFQWLVPDCEEPMFGLSSSDSLSTRWPSGAGTHIYVNSFL